MLQSHPTQLAPGPEVAQEGGLGRAAAVGKAAQDVPQVEPGPALGHHEAADRLPLLLAADDAEPPLCPGRSTHPTNDRELQRRRALALGGGAC